MSGKFVTTQIWITCLASQRSKENSIFEKRIDQLIVGAKERAKEKRIQSVSEFELVA